MNQRSCHSALVGQRHGLRTAAGIQSGLAGFGLVSAGRTSTSHRGPCWTVGMMRRRGSAWWVFYSPFHWAGLGHNDTRGGTLPQLLPPALRVRATGRVHGKHRLSLPTIDEAPGLRRHRGRGGQVQQDGRVRRGDRAAGAAEAEPLRRGRRGAGAVHHCSEFTRWCPAHWQPWARDTAIGWSLVATGMA
eukprot:COSAG06_NODE_1165_length_10453_cov_11.516032_7_plen_189_part_00